MLIKYLYGISQVQDNVINQIQPFELNEEWKDGTRQ